MRIIATDKLDAATLESHERFFVELWYGMTHMRSLDSHRVRCLNARTIVRELADELQIGLIDEPELGALCEEAREILRDDPVVQRRFGVGLAVVEPSLKNPPIQKPDKGKNKPEQQQRERAAFLYALEDFSASLDDAYFAALCEELPNAIKPDNAGEIKAVTDALLSDLLDRGWTLESLFRWHTVFLRTEKKDKHYSFRANLGFLLKQLSREKQPFEVTLRLSGSEKLKAIGGFGDFKLVSEVTVPSPNKLETSFLAPNPYATFATRTIDAVDDRSAAVEARGSLEDLLDLLRFEFEQSVVEIDETSLVRRIGGGKRTLPQIRHTVPNPVEGMGPESFVRFVRDLGAVVASSQIDASSERQLLAAIRQYRFGRDSEGFKDKFLNWWMGLEALSHIGRGKGIGPQVTHNVSRAMMKGYLFRLLRDLLTALKYCEVNWTDELAKHSGCTEIGGLSISRLLVVLQSEGYQAQLWEQCRDHPVLVFRGQQLGECLLDAEKTADLLERHLRHIGWHIHRLYRIRCCIVHGSPIRFRLSLYTANLEYYLKQTTLFVLESFRDNAHVRTLDELFARGAISFDRVVASLRDKKASAKRVREAVYADVAVKEGKEE